MRNTLLINMRDDSSVNCIDSVAADENTINLVFYSRNASYSTKVTLIDVEGVYHYYNFMGDDVYYFQIPSRYYSYGQQSVYIILSDSGNYTSERIQLFFVGREEATDGEMYITKIQGEDYYTVYYKKSLSNAEVVQQLEETEQALANTNEQVQSISNTVAQSTTLNESLIESLTTNLTKYALRPRVTHRTDGWEWTDFVTNPDSTVTYTPCFSTSSTSTLRSYINIEDVKIKYLTEELTVPSDYSKITEAETDYLTVNGKQIYYTDLSTLDGFTMISPRNFDSTITAHVEDMYKCRKLKAAGDADWNIEIFQSVSSSTVEGETVINKTVGVKFDDVATVTYDSNIKTFRFTKINENDNNERGIKVEDSGAYYTNDGINWYLIGGLPTAEVVRIIDHVPTEGDLTGQYTVFARYDPEDTSSVIVDSAAGKIYNSPNVYVEIPVKSIVAISPQTAAVPQGATQQFAANVPVEWSVTGGSGTTAIDSSGLLTVDEDEVIGTVLTITAISTEWPTDRATATATVMRLSNMGEILGRIIKDHYGSTYIAPVTQASADAYANAIDVTYPDEDAVKVYVLNPMRSSTQNFLEICARGEAAEAEEPTQLIASDITQYYNTARGIDTEPPELIGINGQTFFGADVWQNYIQYGFMYYPKSNGCSNAVRYYGFYDFIEDAGYWGIPVSIMSAADQQVLYANAMANAKGQSCGLTIGYKSNAETNVHEYLIIYMQPNQYGDYPATSVTYYGSTSAVTIGTAARSPAGMANLPNEGWDPIVTSYSVRFGQTVGTIEGTGE